MCNDEQLQLAPLWTHCMGSTSFGSHYTYAEIGWVHSMCTERLHNTCTYLLGMCNQMRYCVVHSQSIKNNIANTEFTTQPDRILCMQKVQAMLLSLQTYTYHT